MSDMLAAIAPKSDQINADDLIGGPITIKIAGVKITPSSEQPVAIQIDGERKVYRPCKSMMRVMVAAWGPDSAAYVGQSLTLYREDSVTWAGVAVGGIRISAMSGIPGPMTLALSLNRKTRKPFTIKPLRGGGGSHKINIEASTVPIFDAPACDCSAEARNALRGLGVEDVDASMEQIFTRAPGENAALVAEFSVLFFRMPEAKRPAVQNFMGCDAEDAPADRLKAAITKMRKTLEVAP